MRQLREILLENLLRCSKEIKDLIQTCFVNVSWFDDNLKIAVPALPRNSYNQYLVSCNVLAMPPKWPLAELLYVRKCEKQFNVKNSSLK